MVEFRRDLWKIYGFSIWSKIFLKIFTIVFLFWIIWHSTSLYFSEIILLYFPGCFPVPQKAFLLSLGGVTWIIFLFQSSNQWKSIMKKPSKPLNNMPPSQKFIVFTEKILQWTWLINSIFRLNTQSLEILSVSLYRLDSHSYQTECLLQVLELPSFPGLVCFSKSQCTAQWIWISSSSSRKYLF